MQITTTNDLLNKMESIIQQLSDSQANACTCKPPEVAKPGLIGQTGPVGTTLEILGKRDLTLTQRSILLYLVFLSSDARQKNICDYLGISMKCTRENCEQLMSLDYIKRGTKASTWSLV